MRSTSFTSFTQIRASFTASAAQALQVLRFPCRRSHCRAPAPGRRAMKGARGRAAGRTESWHASAGGATPLQDRQARRCNTCKITRSFQSVSGRPQEFVVYVRKVMRSQGHCRKSEPRDPGFRASKNSERQRFSRLTESIWQHPRPPPNVQCWRGVYSTTRSPNHEKIQETFDAEHACVQL